MNSGCLLFDSLNYFCSSANVNDRNFLFKPHVTKFFITCSLNTLDKVLNIIGFLLFMDAFLPPHPHFLVSSFIISTTLQSPAPLIFRPLQHIHDGWIKNCSAYLLPGLSVQNSCRFESVFTVCMIYVGPDHCHICCGQSTSIS